MSDAWECNIGSSLCGIASHTCVRELQKGKPSGSSKSDQQRFAGLSIVPFY